MQNFYLWKKDKKTLKEIKNKDKELLIQVQCALTPQFECRTNFFYSKVFNFFSSLQENFCGTSIIVPDLEAVLHLKEDGKKSWKPKLFQLRASGIYYVPKGKSKVRGQSTVAAQLNLIYLPSQNIPLMRRVLDSNLDSSPVFPRPRLLRPV